MVFPERAWRALKIEYAIARRGLLRLQQSDGHVIDRTSAHGFSFKTSVVGVTVHDQVCAMAINNLRQTGSAEEGGDFGPLAFHGTSDRGVVYDNYALLGAQLGHGALKLEGFINRCLNELLNLNFAESGQHVAAEASD